MPFHPPPGRPEEYPERDHPRRPWDEWGSQEQELKLREALGLNFTEANEGNKVNKGNKMGQLEQAVVACPKKEGTYYCLWLCRQRKHAGWAPCVRCSAPDRPVALGDIIFNTSADSGAWEELIQ